MARIGLAIVGAIIGSFAGPLGAQIGFSLGGLLGAALFPPKVPTQFGPRLNDRQVTSSANGSPIPWGYGTFRIGGEIIWAEKIKETKNTEKHSAKGGPSVTTVTYTYSATLAIAFCEGPADITRIWGDSKLLYDRTGSGPQKVGTGMSNTGTTTVTVDFTFYRGTSDQLPDPTIQAIEGIARTPAFRDLCYVVLNDFPLADFGNRIPNFRAEITVASAIYPRKTYPGPSLVNSQNQITPPSYVFIDPFSRNGFSFGIRQEVGQRIALDSTATVTPPNWQANHTYSIGNQILDFNGNIQTVFQVGGSHQSGSSEPAWATADGATTTENGGAVVWRNSGPGPTVPVVDFAGQLWDSATNKRWAANFSDVTTMGVDTAGRIWNIAYNVANGGGDARLFRYDPVSFQPIGSISIGGGIGANALAFARVNGKDLLYVFVASNQGSYAGKFFIFDANSLASLSINTTDTTQIPSWLPTPTWNNPSAYLTHPAIDPRGIVYKVAFNGVSDPNWYIIGLDGRGYKGIVKTVMTFPPGTGTYESGTTALYCAADNSLIVLAGGGAIPGVPTLLKVDIATQTIVASVSNAYTLGGTTFNRISKAYKGTIPGDGILRIPHNVSGVWNIDYYDCRTLTLVNRVPIPNWLSAILSDGFTDIAYDEVTNSFLVTVTGYSGLWFRIWLDRVNTNGELLSDIVTDLLQRTGLASSDIDTSALSTTTVGGYAITSTVDTKAALQPLTTAFFFDLVESDFKLKAVPRGGSPVMLIPETDLGIESEKFAIQENIAQQNDIPKQVTVVYYDPALDLQQGKQLKYRSSRVVNSKQQVILQLPINMTSTDARNIAEKALATWWAERNQYSFKLWNAKYLQLDPADVVQFTYLNTPFQARMVRTSEGQNHVLEVSAVSEDPRNYIAVQPGGDTVGFTNTKILSLGPTTLFLLDIPLLQDQDASPAGITGFYYAMSSPTSGWPGGVLFESQDDQNYIQDEFDDAQATFGYVANATPAPLHSPFSWDNDTTINVRLVQGTLESTTDLAVLNGANACYLGGEIIQFVNAVLQSDGSYTLSRLLRGRRGTEGFAKTHTTGETFILLTAGTTKRHNTNTASIGATRYYKAVTLGNPVTGAATQQLVSTGADLKPYAPAQFGGTRGGDGSFSISWVRRTRVGGAWLDGTGTVPLSEDSESYDLEILNAAGTAVVRTVSGLNTPSYFYSATNVQADFGSLPQTIRARVYQNSATVGRGFPAQNDNIGGFGAVSGGGDATSINGVPIVGTPVDGDVLTYIASANQWQPQQTTLARKDVTKTTASLANGSAETGSIDLGAKSFILLRAVTTRPCRLQLYATAADRDADTRAVNFLPPTGTETGVICDIVLTDDLDWEASPPLIGANMDSTPSNLVYYRITNLGTTGTVPVTLTILPMEVARH